MGKEFCGVNVLKLLNYKEMKAPNPLLEQF